MAEKKELEKVEPSVAAKFTEVVMREFKSSVGKVALTEYQMKLSQHLFVKIDATLNTLEAKRLAGNKQGTPIAWANMNMNKLAVDVVHRVELGLDALIPNHISPIPYFNTRLKVYDLDLRVGYTGKDYYRRNMATDAPVDIIYELVHENDNFVPLKRTNERSVESYNFDINNPFDRGEVIGGFGYIKYKDSSKNQLVIVTKADFDKAKGLAKSKDFWANHEEKMQFKTLVNRVTDKLDIDPRKVNAAFVAVEKNDAADRMVVEAEISEVANHEAVKKTTHGTIKCPDINNGVVAKAKCEKCAMRPGCPAYDKTEEGK